MPTPEVSRYSFYQVFTYNQITGSIFPKVNVRINGVGFTNNVIVPKGPTFGGLDLYQYMGRDMAGIWNDQLKELVIVGFY